MWLWFQSTSELNYQERFYVDSDIDQYVELIKKWGGESRTASVGGSKRGWCFSVEHLPLEVVSDVFLLVRGEGRKEILFA